MSPLGVFVAADVFGTVIDNETDQAIVGQDYGQMARHLDYICPMVYPSHYVNGAYGISVPDAEPYQTIFSAMSSSAETLAGIKEEKAKVRVWLQGFTASWVPGHISYGRAQIREQIKGAYDAGYEEWILWNAAVRYERDSLLTDEEAETERKTGKRKRQGGNADDRGIGLRHIDIMCHADREFKRHDAACDRGFAGGGSDRSGRYAQQHKTVEPF